jgi:hypothetical protein
MIEGEDGDKANQAREELISKFEAKYREYEKKEKEFYDSLLVRVEEFPAIEERDKELEQLEKYAQAMYTIREDLYEDKVVSDVKEGREWFYVSEDPSVKQPKIHPDFKELRREWNKIRLEYSRITKDSKVWRIPDLKIDEIQELIIKKHSTRRTIHDPPIWEINEELFDNLWREESSSNRGWIDIAGNGSPELYLKEKWRMKKGTRMSSHDVFELFNMVLFFVNTHENFRSLKHHLAFALSGENGSLNWFERFIQYILHEQFYIKFQRDLGIEEPKNYI